MPRYFFTVESPTLRAEDDEGEEYTDDVAAHHAAVEIARELAGVYQNATVVVRSESGRLVTEVLIGKLTN